MAESPNPKQRAPFSPVKSPFSSDDKLERAQASAARATAVRHKSIVRNTYDFSDADQCPGKEEENTSELNLIGHLCEIIKVEEENDAETNFQKHHRSSKYNIRANNQILEIKQDPKKSSMKDLVARETSLLLEQQQRISIGDLICKFEKGLADAVKPSDEARLNEAASLEKHVLLKKLGDALEALRGRVAGRNIDDVEEAILMVEALEVQSAQREGELIQEKAEVKKLTNFLKQFLEDAKVLVDKERAFALAEIENARAVVQNVEGTLQEHERMSKALRNQDLDELIKEVRVARRIQMLHKPSRVMDMERELQALRIQLAEKSKHSIQLQKELAICKSGDKMLGICTQ